MSNFFKHMSESLKSLIRNGWMTTAAISSVFVTLLLVGIFGSVVISAAKLASDVQENVRLIAYVMPNIHDQEKTVEIPGQYTDSGKLKRKANPDYQKVYKAIKKEPGVEKVVFSSKDEQLQNLIKRFGDTFTMYKNDDNPLDDAYIIDAKTPEDVKRLQTSLSKIKGIERVNGAELEAGKLISFADGIRFWGLIGTVLLLLTAVFLISNTIRITIISRSREIQIMRLVGAKNSYIRWPFLLEGAWVGLLGSLIPIGIIAYGYGIIYKNAQPSLAIQELHLFSPGQFVPVMALTLVMLGIVIGAIGSLLSMRRYLKF